MNRKQLQYVIGLSEDLNFSVVAEKLGISQSYISRIEKKVIRRLKCLTRY